jgi:tetratricopeptide (TPR) repeat protein
MFLRYVVVAAALSLAPVAIVPAAFAQSASDHVTMGDKEYTAPNAAAALKHYEAALATDPQQYEALWKASRTAIDVGEATADAKERAALYKRGTEYARRAVAANPTDAEGHFHLARSLGRTALTLGSRDRVKYASEVRKHALQALEYNPQHAGALHVMGMWNAEVMRLSGVSRFFAKNLLGGDVFGKASWKEAVRYMEQAVAVEPNRLVHRVDLAEIHKDMKNKAKARAEAEYVMKATASEPNDDKYKAQAERLLAELR